MVSITRPYQICTRCLMDTSDPEIQFDENGVCNHCRSYEALAKRLLLPEAERQLALERLVDEIKKDGQGKEYDCVIGVSGGVDSTYVAYLVKKLGLRPLAVHMDNGWNSELAVSNIEKFLKLLGVDLYTHVLDWEEFKDLQIAFLKASVSDGEIPTDHAIGAVLYQVALNHGVSYILSGANFATEAILPESWTYGIGDWRYIHGIQKRFGKVRLKHYPKYTYFDKLYYSLIKKIKIIYILDMIDYNKKQAVQVLQDELGWRYYGGKHYESIYTRFFQGYILPRKFNIDKRKAHLSTLIMSGQITRSEALNELSIPAYAGYMQEEDMEYVLKKLELSEGDFEQIMALPVKTYRDYPSYQGMQNLMNDLGVYKIAGLLGLRSKFKNNDRP